MRPEKQPDRTRAVHSNFMLQIITVDTHILHQLVQKLYTLTKFPKCREYFPITLFLANFLYNIVKCAPVEVNTSVKEKRCTGGRITCCREKSKGKAFPAQGSLHTLKRKCSIHSINYGSVWT